MTIIQRLQKIWHDIYYALAPKTAVDFAMRCQDVAHQIDLGDSLKTPKQKFRRLLHMSLCQACRNYEGYSRWLNKEATQIKLSKLGDDTLIKLNSRLLKTHSKTTKS